MSKRKNEAAMAARRISTFFPGEVVSMVLMSLLFLSSLASSAAVDTNPFQTNLELSQLDPASFTQFVDGVETPMARPDAKGPLLQELIATRTTWKIGRQKFGGSKTPGPRSLRIGFLEPVGVGTVLAVGDVSLSVLKPDAPYPGNLGDDSQWIPAQRIERGEATSAQAAEYQCAAWRLPHGTRTRVLRFTHTAQPLDKEYSGILQGVRILASRFANLAPQAMPFGRISRKIEKINNEGAYDGWFAWDNFDSKKDVRLKVVADAPEWLMLAWPESVVLRGVAFWWTGFSAGELQTYAGPDGVPPRTPPRRIGRPSPL